VVRSGRESEAKSSFTSILTLTKLVLLKYCTKMGSSVGVGDGCNEEGSEGVQIRNKISE
jgi:hypothetical protein